ncbi:MAG: ATP-NAD kinase family protein [Gammaproteobacteria bacterium]|nr:ATP-NAD kinase family protein [Gammaproteobacteria bacterium]
MNRKFRLGLIVNPFAGLGGSVALKGSDGPETVELALSRGAKPRSSDRAALALAPLMEIQDQILIVTVPGEMGGDVAKHFGCECRLLSYSAMAGQSSAEDTRKVALAIVQQEVDLLLFVGGDGTARDVFSAIGLGPVCLGVPAGVKMQSGVYANTPTAAGELVKLMIKGEVLSLMDAEVRDIDEASYREGRLESLYFGELRVPMDLRYLQHVKCGGLEKEELVLTDIAAEVCESLEESTLCVIGAGTTTMSIKQEMGIEGTLLGVDVIKNGCLLNADATENQLVSLLRAQSEDTPVKIVLTLIGGQGHLFGRGNQQISPVVIRMVKKENIIVVASKTKLRSLQHRPILLDTGDQSLDEELAGYFSVITGYEDYVLYPAG